MAAWRDTLGVIFTDARLDIRAEGASFIRKSRWCHLVRHRLQHRALTGWQDNGKLAFIGCDCGKMLMFWTWYS